MVLRSWRRIILEAKLISCSDALPGSNSLLLLWQVKRKYRIAPSIAFSEGRSSGLLLLEGKPRESFKAEKDDFRPLTKSQIDSDLAKMRNMTAQEAAAAAAQAVAEAEAALAEAEEAAREAEAAEADAEAAQAFAEAAMMELKNRNTSKLVIFLLQAFLKSCTSDGCSCFEISCVSLAHCCVCGLHSY